jgi:hypothetical protein
MNGKPYVGVTGKRFQKRRVAVLESFMKNMPEIAHRLMVMYSD